LTTVKEASTFSPYERPCVHRHSATPTEGGFAMDQFVLDQFVERQNIAHYLERLKTENDPTTREILQNLLAKEMTKQKSHEISTSGLRATN
jgi:hypothetical protein